jgi:phosphoglucosamine mutase
LSGTNINAQCGSTHPESLARLTVEKQADLGLAFDGDADRVILVDGLGRLFDGDRMLLTYAIHQNLSTVVGTVMSNLGLEQALAKQNKQLIRASVGDRYVAEKLRESQAKIGGEQSGHVIFPEIAPAGDGMLTGLQLLKIIQESGRSLASWFDEMITLPQQLINIKVREQGGWENEPEIKNAIAETEALLAGRGRLLVRASGTEKLIRVMAEAPTDAEVAEVCERVAAVIRRVRG